MKQIDVNKQLGGDVSAFFAVNALSHAYYMNGDHNLSVDGTGKDVSVSESIATKIGKYVSEKFKCDNKLVVLDIGTGLGNMVKGLQENNIDSYGLEGSKTLADKIVCDKDRVVIADLSQPLGDNRLNKAFHLTTSFEVFEHVHRSHEDQFLANLAYLADYHLCSINIDEWPGLKETHCNIKHLCCWLELFKRHSITYEVLGAATSASTLAGHEGDIGIPTGYNKITDNEEFRQHTGCEWPFSIFCLLDLRNFVV